MRTESSKCRRVQRTPLCSCWQDSKNSLRMSRITLRDLKGRLTVSRCSMRRRSLNKMMTIVEKPSN
jgi:hypothetical protein